MTAAYGESTGAGGTLNAPACGHRWHNHTCMKPMSHAEDPNDAQHACACSAQKYVTDVSHRADEIPWHTFNNTYTGQPPNYPY